MHLLLWRRNVFDLFFSLFFFYLKCNSITAVGHDVSVKKGGNITLFCHLIETEENLIHIIWQKQTRENPKQETFLIIDKDGKTEHKNDLLDKVKFIGNIKEKNGSVQLLGMTLLDDGIYTCIFIFPSGQNQTNINVTVLDPPELVVISPDDPTQPQEYLCSVDCNPTTPTSYIWIKVNGSTPHFEGNKLFIPKSSSDFNGVYICTASNQYGSASGFLYVNNTGSTDDCWLLLGMVFSCVILWISLAYTLSNAGKMPHVPRSSKSKASFGQL